MIQKRKKKTKIENSKPISIINIKENITNEILKSLMPEMQGWTNTWKCIDKMYRINTRKEKDHVIISIYPEKEFDKSQQSFMIKILKRFG